MQYIKKYNNNTFSNSSSEDETVIDDCGIVLSRIFDELIKNTPNGRNISESDNLTKIYTDSFPEDINKIKKEVNRGNTHKSVIIKLLDQRIKNCKDPELNFKIEHLKLLSSGKVYPFAALNKSKPNMLYEVYSPARNRYQNRIRRQSQLEESAINDAAKILSSMKQSVPYPSTGKNKKPVHKKNTRKKQQKSKNNTSTRPILSHRLFNIRNESDLFEESDTPFSKGGKR